MSAPVPIAHGRASFLRGLRHSPVALGASGFVLLLVLACVCASLIAPYDPQDQDLSAVLQTPSGAHLLGTDTLGRDVLSRLLFGGQRSLLSVAEGLAVVLALGIPLGLVAGYVGGWTDRLVGTVGEVLMAIPAIIFILVVLTVRPHDEDAAMLVFGLLGAPTVMRVVRASTLSVREELYVSAARIAGLTHPRIVVRHVLPRAMGPIIVQGSLFCAYALIFETGLAFLGLIGDTHQPTWGGMVGEASTVLEQQRWLLFPPGLTIAFMILAFGLLGDAVRDAAVRDPVPAHRRRGERAGRVRGRPKTRAARGSTAVADAPLPTVPHALLAVEDLHVVAGGTTVVEGVNFSLAASETVGLVGESGCGKTVTARSLLRLLGHGLDVAGGRVWLDGRDVLQLDDRAFDALRGSTIAYISQEPQTSLDPTFTVGSQLAEIVRHHDRSGRREARGRALELLELVDLPDPERVARSHPHELSGGMAQRVAIAIALAGRPRLLVADEPTTALDVTVQAEVLGLLRRLQAETGMAVLLVTHDWGVVADLCDRTLVMYAGQIVEQAAVQEMFDQPMHPYTLDLLASHPSLATTGQPMAATAGSVPAPGTWPVGCRFADRCPFAVDECRGHPVPAVHPTDSRLVRCVRVEELFGEAASV